MFHATLTLSYISGDSKESFTLSESALEAFEALKQALAKPVKLNLIDRNRPTYLETDASYHGYGSCCYQVAYFDKDSADKLKAWQADIQNRFQEELDSQAKEAINITSRMATLQNHLSLSLPVRHLLETLS